MRQRLTVAAGMWWWIPSFLMSVALFVAVVRSSSRAETAAAVFMSMRLAVVAWLCVRRRTHRKEE